MISASDISLASSLLRLGKLVIFPTETVYGLGALATDSHAIAGIFAAKSRPRFNPLIIHVADIEAAFSLGDFSSLAHALGSHFWPGALTIIVPRSPQCPVVALASAGLDSIALRVPSHPVARSLLRSVGIPIAAPSANMSGRLSSTRASHIHSEFGDSVGLILDGGLCSFGIESTIISFLDSVPRLLRPGAIPREEIEDFLGFSLEDSSIGFGREHGPGFLSSHYAPRADLRLNSDCAVSGEGFLTFGNGFSVCADCIERNLSPSGDLREAASHLFDYLHDLDSQVSSICVVPIPEIGLGEAINDRLRRAAAPRMVGG